MPAKGTGTACKEVLCGISRLISDGNPWEVQQSSRFPSSKRTGSRDGHSMAERHSWSPERSPRNGEFACLNPPTTGLPNRPNPLGQGHRLCYGSTPWPDQTCGTRAQQHSLGHVLVAPRPLYE
ncbi:hypothetical protein P7K49_017642 [Saguinus oedipus]|uniref:Uncharacterized protein n=1 Tax=Saguinus oedipus TaxID=9490 RepID=A0ABQ9V3H5_SAGOE|nr:hypothetical protein P7K49_017642 [Saguinus oedipus]